MQNFQNEIKKEVGEKTIGYISTALGLIAGLAWNEAVKSLIDYVFPLDKSGLLAKFIYALMMTAIVILFSFYLAKLTRQKTEN